MFEIWHEATHAPAGEASRGWTALLIIDMLGNPPFPGGTAMKREAARAARTIAALRDAAASAGVPVIFIDDHAAPAIVAKSRSAGASLRASADDHVIPKSQFSAFHLTPLQALLERLEIDRLVLGGVATDIGVMFTAADAHMRDYRLWVPEDAVAGTSAARSRWALELMRQSMSAETRPTSALPLIQWR